MSVKLAVFDMDGTLIDSLPDLADCARQLLSSYSFPEVTDTEVRAMIGNGVAALVERLLASALRKGADVGSISPAEACERFMEFYTPRATRYSRLFPGTEETLKTMRAQGWRLAVCTNKPEVAALAILERFGLFELFSCVGGGDSFPARKPDPVHLLGTIKKADGTPEQSVMIGDMSPDLIAARSAGCRSLFAAWGYGGPELAEMADMQVADMHDVPKAAEQLLAGSV
ncbi:MULTISPECIES: HAD hydrolase-like protein [Acetobacter]|uniref:HAD hydrolase-like protein n=1 Tax=Acetobacter TaxID=434 RepID=UPI000A3D6136|nr:MULTISPECIES: HAD hydrolase-like protein [Acetobacter]MBS0959448.1 HAD hydrolase-like protein [Acetobacter thailandicus]MBS0980635.1 HAD hydrolase-like protein [Acetobacter thailandicus]MBS0984659.1 HAD hydrolase-like protein [Acetobacter thailandicus]OUI88076.1 phosphoglycolate phosphatase [Acetobacter sp. DmW_043]